MNGIKHRSCGERAASDSAVGAKEGEKEEEELTVGFHLVKQ